MLGDLDKQRFDLGIGGLNMADTILFRHLDIPYLKLSEEDLESYNMQFKLNIPILMSAYPSVSVYSRDAYGAETYEITSGSFFDRYTKSLYYRGVFAWRY